MPSNKVKKPKREDSEDGEHETLEEAMGIDADVRHLFDSDEEKPENILRFNQVMNTFMVPFVLYVDFEAFINKEGAENEDVDKHEPSGFCCLRVSAFDFLNDEEAFVYSGPDVMSHFYDHIMQEHATINEILSRQMPMTRLTADEQQRYDAAIVCDTCKINFTDENIKVRHHCHVTGKFLSAACNNCNLQLKPRKAKKNKIFQQKCAKIKAFVDKEMKTDCFFVPVIAHNMRGYDSHLIIKHMEQKFTCQDVRVIANNTEKFIAFQIGQLRFLDSLQFLNASLDALVANLKKDGLEYFNHTSRHFSDLESFSRVTSKGVYPYEYMDGPEKFLETSLPPIDKFFSKLCDSNISQDNYDRARDVWNHFKIQNMRQYHDLYLKTDTLLLADVFENFRRVAKSNYDLDPCHYYTSPGLSLSACLKYTNVQLELFTDPEHLLFIEKGIRGGISTITNRYAKANNEKYFPDDFDPSLPSKHIMYLDANNLYGYAMSQPLPVGGFKFLTREEILDLDLNQIGEDDEVGYIYEVDLGYSEELHDIHNDYPLAPESFPISSKIHSPYARRLLKKLGRKPCGETKKLVPNLCRKRRYVVHYRNLQFYVKQGLIIEKTHRVLKFTQSKWLEPYISLNTEKRKNASSTFEKDFYKLMNNSLFGKTMESLRKRIDVKLVTDQIQAERYVAKPEFETFKIINEYLTMIKSGITKIFWDKPTSIGFCVLELSKLLMYRHHYEYMVPRYGKNAKLLFTDTDSLCYEITTKNVYADMKSDLELFDTSDYPKDHPNYSPVNCKVVGKFKDECNGVPVYEFVGLRAKMYSILLSDGRQKSTAKGIKTSFARKYIKHQLYRQCLFDESTTSATYHQIGSTNHQLGTRKIAKSALSPFDDKRYLLADTTDTLAYGHYKIREMERNAAVVLSS